MWYSLYGKGTMGHGKGGGLLGYSQVPTVALSLKEEQCCRVTDYCRLKNKLKYPDFNVKRTN